MIGVISSKHKGPDQGPDQPTQKAYRPVPTFAI